MKFKITTDVDKCNGIGKDIKILSYEEPVDRELELFVFPKSQIHEYHDFTEEPVIKDYGISLVASTPNHIFTTKYTKKITRWDGTVYNCQIQYQCSRRDTRCN